MNNQGFSRRRLLQLSGKLSALAALGIPSLTAAACAAHPATLSSQENPDSAILPAAPLHPPPTGAIPVAFLISEGAVMIDFAGPWEVFQDASNPSTRKPAFQLYTVAETSAPVRASGGMKIVPDYILRNAPAPKVLVIPAQQSDTPAMLNWIREVTRHTDLTMSVCTGSFLLAETGLLKGRSATTHHAEYKPFAVQYPDVHVQRGVRFVEDGNLATSGGLSSGIDLALRVVDRYFGQKTAQQTADNLEYQGKGWLNPNSNSVYLAAATPDDHPHCIVCGMEADPSLTAQYHGKTYYFCEEEHRKEFLAAPDKYAN